MTAPLLTVKMPIYNAERFLAESIRSVQAQTFGDFEVIAVLDGCTDRSEEILMDLKDERFRIVKHETNQGVIVGLNEGIQLAKAPFIARIDADDVMEPERLRKQYEFMIAQPEIDILGTWYNHIDETGRAIKQAFPFPAEHEQIRHDFRVRNCIGGPTMCLRTERIRLIGGYTVQEPYAEDLTLSLKCLAAGYRFANIPEVLMHYRVIRGQLSDRRKAETWHMTNLAYMRYGRQIWGDDAPDFELGAPLHRRVLKKIKRMFRG